MSRDIKVIQGTSEEAIWSEVAQDLANTDLLEYDVILQLDMTAIEFRH